MCKVCKKNFKIRCNAMNHLRKHLEKLRMGEADEESWRFCMERDRRKIWASLPQARKDAFDRALKLVPTHDLMERINASKLEKLQAQTVRILCDGDRSKPDKKALGRDDGYQGLRVELDLAPGARVIL